jgi:hypothetical protein
MRMSSRTLWRGSRKGGLFATIGGLAFDIVPSVDGWACGVYVGRERWVMERKSTTEDAAKQRCRKFAAIAKGDHK